jgi:uncharacterized membrane protein
MKKQYLYGALGFLSLLGFVGLFTKERSFLAFFAFVVDFRYFFLPSDEMAESQLTRAAALGFVAGMLAMAAGTLGTLVLGGDPGQSMAVGCAVGWAMSVVAFALTTALYGFRESWGLGRDS